MIPHILLMWSMSISTITGTEHGDWKYLGTYESNKACQQAFVDLSAQYYNIYGTFKCMPDAYLQQEVKVQKKTNTDNWVRY